LEEKNHKEVVMGSNRVLLKRSRLVKVRKRIQAALKDKFSDNPDKRRLWENRLKAFDILDAGGRSDLVLSNEINLMKNQMKSDEGFTQEFVDGLGNGHDKHCPCLECKPREPTPLLCISGKPPYGILKFKTAKT
jgi:hypothetical protein